MAQPVKERFPKPLRRSLVAGAFLAHGKRGTREELAATLSLAADTDVTVTEPAVDAALWQLGGAGSVLGFSTALAPAEAQGAVVGTTGQNRSIAPDRRRRRRLAALCRRRASLLRPGRGDGVAPDRRSALAAAIENEKPAHTIAHLCVIEPRTSVGFQCSVGVDMVVGGDPPTLRLGGALDGSSALRDVPHWNGVGSAVGESNRVGPRPAVMGGR